MTTLSFDLKPFGLRYRAALQCWQAFTSCSKPSTRRFNLLIIDADHCEFNEAAAVSERLTIIHNNKLPEDEAAAVADLRMHKQYRDWMDELHRSLRRALANRNAHRCNLRRCA